MVDSHLEINWLVFKSRQAFFSPLFHSEESGQSSFSNSDRNGQCWRLSWKSVCFQHQISVIQIPSTTLNINLPTNCYLEKTKIDEKEAEKSPSLKVPVSKFQITIFKYFFSMPFLMIAFYIPSRDTSPRGKWTIY